MSTDATTAPVFKSSSNVTSYRALSRGAVCAIGLGVLGWAVSFFAPILIVVPVLGAICGRVAIGNIKKYPDELAGMMAARIGFIISIVCVIASLITHSVIYATEVPENYHRISFGELRPNDRTALPFAEKAKQMDGQRVFLKGYVRPPSGKKNRLKSFIMVGDFGDCCFGGNPKITEVVAIRIKSDDTVDYGYGLRKIGGVFRLNPNTTAVNEKDIPQVFYEIEADYVR